MKQYVYKFVPDEEFEATKQSASCYMISSVYDLVYWMLPILRVLGFKETIKLLLKLLLGKSTMYIYSDQTSIKSYGIVTFGYCKLYPIEFDAAVIGPVNTVTGNEGRGLATSAINHAISWLLNTKRVSAVYIDTSESNIAMQRVIGKAGFIGPVLTFDRV